MIEQTHFKCQDTTNISQRVKSVLNYDHVPKEKQAKHIADLCRMSRSTAYRLLKQDAKDNIYKRHIFELAEGLGVDVQWLYGGLPGYQMNCEIRCLPRTMRIHVQEICGYPKQDTDRIMRLFIGVIAGHSKATNILNLAASGQITYVTAGRLL